MITVAISRSGEILTTMPFSLSFLITNVGSPDNMMIPGGCGDERS